MDGRKDVFEYLIDGTSGLAPGSVSGQALVVGVSSLGTPGKVYYLGASSDLTGLFGVGPLVDTLRDIFTTAGQDAVVFASPAAASVPGQLGAVTTSGTGPALTASGAPRCSAEIVLEVVKAGGRNVGQYRLSTDGGDNFGPYRTIPVDGAIAVGSTGVTLTAPATDLILGDVYSCRLRPPQAAVTDVIASIRAALEVVDPEFCCVAGASDSVAWAALGALADELWNRHRPLYFLCEARLPADAEDLDAWTSALVLERQGFAHRFVSVCAAHGEISDSTGRRRLANAVGLLAGRIISIPVQRDVGRVRDGGVTQLTLPEYATEAQQVALEKAGYVTGARYAGLEGVYWGDARTMAEDTSDYQTLEVIRVVFKAVRLLRIQALKSLKDEAGDPYLAGGAGGLLYLQANLENALASMVKAIPQELAGYRVRIPEGQDIVNNGVAVETTLIGIPIIKKIKLFASYVYAGSAFDPRLQ